MQRLTVSLVALQVVVACGYAVQADEARRPADAASPTVHAVATAPATAAPAAKAEKADPLTLRLTPRFVSAPGFLRSLVRIAPNAENRVLRIEIDSERYYRASEIELDGASAPESHFIDFKAVPAGHYQLTVTVMGPTGPRMQRQLPFQVLGVGAED